MWTYFIVPGAAFFMGLAAMFSNYSLGNGSSELEDRIESGRSQTPTTFAPIPGVDVASGGTPIAA